MWEGKSIIHVDPGKTERHTRINFPSCHDVYELENHDISTHYPYKMFPRYRNLPHICQTKVCFSIYQPNCLDYISKLYIGNNPKTQSIPFNPRTSDNCKKKKSPQIMVIFNITKRCEYILWQGKLKDLFTLIWYLTDLVHKA